MTISRGENRYLGAPHNRYGEKRNYFHISQGKDERTDEI